MVAVWTMKHGACLPWWRMGRSSMNIVVSVEYCEESKFRCPNCVETIVTKEQVSLFVVLRQFVELWLRLLLVEMG